MTFTISAQWYRVSDYPAPLTWAVYVEDYDHEHDECWGAKGFVCYSRTREGAQRVVEFLTEDIMP